MSVWKRFQRVGKRAAKYQYTASYTELVIETNNFKLSNLVITWLRRNRKYSSEPIKLIDVPSKPNSYSYVWEVPRNEEIQTTLYKMKKDVQFEEKDWTFQLEDVGSGGTRRRLLAYRNINLSQYAEATPTQNDIKINFKISSKKIKSATLFLTLSAVCFREGEATDEDMISVASLMSLPSNPSFLSSQLNDIAVLNDLEDMDNSITSSYTININDKINELCDQIGSLNWDTEVKSESNLVTKELPSNSPVLPNAGLGNPYSASKPISIKTDYKDDQLFSIEEDDISGNVESNSTSNLMEWCQSITEHYNDIQITNFTTSFRSGMAFCAIIHYFHPDLIDLDSLKPTNVKENNRIAFTVAASLGIPKVLDANEMNFLKVPDSLSVMTYLHQLKTHFTDNNLVVTPASIGNNSSSNYFKQTPSSLSTSPTVVKNINTINLPTTEYSDLKSSTINQCSPQSRPDVTSIAEIETTTKTDESESLNFFSESEIIPEPIIITTPEITEKVTKSNKNRSPKKQKKTLASFNVDGTVKDKWSLSEKKIKPISLVTLNMLTEIDSKENHTNMSSVPVQPNGHAVSPLCPKKSTSIYDNNTNENYISAETKDLEREQDKIDEEASQLERQIRLVMEKNDKKSESILMEKWFHIVNKKNALIRRNMQLQILEKEQNLELKWNLLQEDLRQILSVEECFKTDEMKRREDLLMKDLVNIINQRDKVVRELDDYEQGIATDMEWARNNQESIMNNSIFTKTLASAKFHDKGCVVQ